MTDREKAFTAALKEINSKLKGATKVDLLKNIGEANVETISTGSLILDSIIGGGIAKGRIVEIFGSEASGKTSIALTAIANVQKAGGQAVFIDVEQAFSPVYAQTLGVNLDKLGFAQPIVAEDCLGMVLSLCKSKAVDLIVLDSVAAMVPKQEYLEEDLGKASMGLIARLMSKALRQIAAAAHQNNCTVIFLNQTRSSLQMYGPSTTTTGGNGLKFYASQRIEVKRKGKVEEGKTVIGNEVLLRCVKNKIAPPYGEGLTVLTYAQGINKSAELLVLGEQLGVITKEGRTYYMTNQHHGDISGGTAVETEDGRVKIGVNPKPVLKEIETNQKLYNVLSKLVLDKLSSVNGMLEIEENTGEETDEFDEDEE